jgi:glycosyltransferase involved in cell wall biosynthesis
LSAPKTIGTPVAAQYLATFLKPEMWHIYRQIRALTAFRPLVFCQKRENATRFPFDDIVTLPKPRTHQLRRLWQKTILRRPITIYRSEARALERQLTAHEAQLIHIYFGHMGVHLSPFIERTRFPVVLSFHGADAQVDHDSPVYAEISRRVLARVSLILARSESIARRIESLGGDPAKIRLHRTGVPLGEIPFTQRTPPADGKWRCVQACRLIAKKGLRTSLRAFAALARENPGSTFAIAGEGPMLEELRALAAELGIADAVTFPGFLSQADLRQLYADSHLFLHPSEIGPDGDQEGIPNSMLEAMASGLPVLATRHGGIPEAVEEGHSGLLVEERDHEALAAALLALTRNSARYEAMSRAASDRVRAHFDIEAQTRVLESYYREAISTNPHKQI